MRKGLGYSVGLAVALSVMMAAWIAGPASAAFPGRNGLLVVQPLGGGGLVEVQPTGRVVRTICTEAPLCGTPSRPRFSPDGRSIAFTDGSSSRVGVVASDGTCLWCLLGPPLTTRHGSTPTFTGNGQAIGVTGGRSLWRLSLTGGPARHVAAGRDAAWSSTGELALVRRGAVWSRGRGRRARFRRLGAGSQPDFSPDGKKLALVRHGWIWVIGVARRTQRRLVQGTGPAWSPDGKQLAYVARGGMIRIVSARGGRSRSLRIRGGSVDWQPLPRRAMRACSVPRGWTFVAASAQGVVAHQPGNPLGGWEGCLRGLGGWHRLLRGDPNDSAYDTRLIAVRLAGRFALLDSTYHDKYQHCQLNINLYDLATGSSTPLASQACDLGPGRGLDWPALDSSGFAAWRALTQLPRSEPLTAVSCPAVSLCLAVDPAGNVASSKDPTGGRSAWALNNLDPTANLSSVSCPTAGFCVAAAGNSGDVFTSSDPADTQPHWNSVLADPANHPVFYDSLVSCPSTALCVLADDSGNIATSTNPAAASPAWSSAQVDSGKPPAFSALACPSSTLCVALDVGGNIFTSTNPTGGAAAWTSAAVDPANGFRLSGGVSCPSTSLCLAVDGSANILSSTDPTGGSAAWKLTPTGSGVLTAVSCPSTSFCVATDNHGDVLTSTNPTGGASAWQASNIDGSNALEGISCPSVAECVAVDGEGNVLSSNAPSAGAAAWNSAPVDVPDCALAGSPCLVEQLEARDDSGTHLVDRTPPGNGTSIANVSLNANNLELSWTHDGARHETVLR